MKILIIVITLGLIGCASSGTSVSNYKKTGFWNETSQSGSERQWTCIESLSFKNTGCN
jgi:hypothetical protein